MESFLLLLLLLSLLSVSFLGQTARLIPAKAPEDSEDQDPEDRDTRPGADRELAAALEALLGWTEASAPEKRGHIPLCSAGGRCALRLGRRFGTLCDCGRGSSCNSYLLRCI